MWDVPAQAWGSGQEVGWWGLGNQSSREESGRSEPGNLGVMLHKEPFLQNTDGQRQSPNQG